MLWDSYRHQGQEDCLGWEQKVFYLGFSKLQLFTKGLLFFLVELYMLYFFKCHPHIKKYIFSSNTWSSRISIPSLYQNSSRLVIDIAAITARIDTYIWGCFLNQKKQEKNFSHVVVWVFIVNRENLIHNMSLLSYGKWKRIQRRNWYKSYCITISKQLKCLSIHRGGGGGYILIIFQIKVGFWFENPTCCLCARTLLIFKERRPYHLWFRKVFKSLKRTEEADNVHLLSVAHPTDMDKQVLQT